MNESGYRVFVSYAHDDQALAEAVVARLKAVSARALYDKQLKAGDRFSERIQRFIAHAHVFMPILTPSSVQRPWVHQEMGYAMGLSIPVLPLAFGRLPDGLASQIHALEVSDAPDAITTRLTAESIRYAAESRRMTEDAIFQCAETLVERTGMLVEYAREVRKLEAFGMVRQRSAFGSFSLPDVRPSSPLWELRENGFKRTEPERRLLQDERRVMEEHARQAGSRLILDTECVKSHSPKATAVRLQILLEFLESMPEERVEVVFATGEIQTGLVMVGDWFMADAVVPMYGQNYQKTVFTRHGPTVRKAVDDFDSDFNELKREKGGASKTVAIAHIMKSLAEAQSDSA